MSSWDKLTTGINDDWSRCPICFEDYSLNHRPTTFSCGHSTCIDHVNGRNPLRMCPICRQPLRSNQPYHVSYNLEEASQLFHSIKHHVDWSKVPLPQRPVAESDQTLAAELLRRDEVFARRLQAELNRQAQTPSNADIVTPAPSNPGPPITAAAATNSSTRETQPSASQFMKTCGHSCDLHSTQRCCACSDRRPNLGRYPAYVDGQGTRLNARRNEWYCSSCKRQ